MAITVGAAKFEYGTSVAAITDSSAIANTAFDAGTKISVIPADGSPLANAVLDIQFAGVPDVGGSVHLYRRDMNISGANNASVPDANFKSTYVGSWGVDLVITRQYVSLPSIPLEADQEFYIENNTGQATTGTTVVTITPKTYNAKV